MILLFYLIVVCQYVVPFSVKGFEFSNNDLIFCSLTFINRRLIKNGFQDIFPKDILGITDYRGN
jgi:hypothetical protein